MRNRPYWTVTWDFAERTLPAGSSHTSGDAPEPVGLGDGVTREEIEAVSASLRLVIFVTLCTLHYLLGGWPSGLYTSREIKRSGFEPWPGTLRCVLGQDTFLSQRLSPHRCTNGYWLIWCRGQLCDGLTSYTRGSRNTTIRFGSKLRLNEH